MDKCLGVIERMKQIISRIINRSVAIGTEIILIIGKKFTEKNRFKELDAVSSELSSYSFVNPQHLH